MLDISNIRISVSTLDGTQGAEKRALRLAVQKKLRIAPDELLSLELRKRSVDARNKSDVRLVFAVRAGLRGGANAERALLARFARYHRDTDVRRVNEPSAAKQPPALLHHADRPVVVGAGCAGLFCALTLARAGLEPLLVERGEDATRRTSAIRQFEETGVLNPESNIQFGIGGAGTFSDGKLATGTKSPAHRQILETLVGAGAPPSILYDAKPHVGSDILPTVVTSLVRTIEGLGGEVRLSCRMTALDISGVGGPHVTGVTLEQKDPETGAITSEHVPAQQVVLACGHSARDVFELLAGRGVALERKTFAMGVRIEHLQATIDRAQYGRFAGHPSLGAAPYKLVAHLDGGRSAFSFCMCPGGFVVAAASEPKGVVTNGMSLSDRAGKNGNAGLLANVFPDDLPGDDVLAGVELQRACEHAAYAAGGGAYRAPAQLVGDFLAAVPSGGPGSVQPTYPRGVTWGDVTTCLPSYVHEALRGAIPLMGRRLAGFDAADAVLTGVETRSSSPVRVLRGDDLQSVSTRGLWPSGEGAGYAGGIMSAATDGIRTANAVLAACA